MDTTVPILRPYTSNAPPPVTFMKYFHIPWRDMWNSFSNSGFYRQCCLPCWGTCILEDIDEPIRIPIRRSEEVKSSPESRSYHGIYNPEGSYYPDSCYHPGTRYYGYRYAPDNRYYSDSRYYPDYARESRYYSDSRCAPESLNYSENHYDLGSRYFSGSGYASGRHYFPESGDFPENRHSLGSRYNVKRRYLPDRPSLPDRLPANIRAGLYEDISPRHGVPRPIRMGFHTYLPSRESIPPRPTRNITPPEDRPETPEHRTIKLTRSERWPGLFVCPQDPEMSIYLETPVNVTEELLV